MGKGEISAHREYVKIHYWAYTHIYRCPFETLPYNGTKVPYVVYDNGLCFTVLCSLLYSDFDNLKSAERVYQIISLYIFFVRASSTSNGSRIFLEAIPHCRI